MLIAVVLQVVRTTGAENPAELVQDGMRMMDAMCPSATLEKQ